MSDTLEFVLQWSKALWFGGERENGTPRWLTLPENAHRFARYAEAAACAERLREEGFDVEVLGVSAARSR
jgi:hypothetical protein